MNLERTAQRLVDEAKAKLGKSLLATDIWIKGDRKSLAGHNPQPAATALFDELNDYIERSLSQSKFPKLKRYFMLELEDDNTVVIVNHGKVLQGMLVSLRNINMGSVISLAVPHLIRTWETEYHERV
ncbi:MAG: hypothetical protein JXX14_19335 [Deltaproteobacteria bacterium]|nr:hypothetical protein [Deltaproteobacteria bacterium]